MPTIEVTQRAEYFIATTHQFARLLPQALQEQVPGADVITIDYAEMTIGGLRFMALTFMMQRAGYAPLSIIIHAGDLLSRHPQTQEPLFRAENLINGVIVPQMRAAGWEA